MHVRRIGETRAVNIREPARNLHHLGPLRPFSPDLREITRVRALSREWLNGNRRQQHASKNWKTHDEIGVGLPLPQREEAAARIPERGTREGPRRADTSVQDTALAPLALAALANRRYLRCSSTAVRWRCPGGARSRSPVTPGAQ